MKRKDIGRWLLIFVNHRWSAISSNTKSALIALLTSLLVARCEDWQERKRNDEEASTLEQNKLIYLDFLITDSELVIQAFGEHSKRVMENYNTNPFNLVSEVLYVDHSLKTIATKINQEEYYLASLNQIENGRVAEILLYYNQLNDNYSLATKTYDETYPLLRKNIMDYEKSLDDLVESVDLYLLVSKSRILNEQERKTVSDIILLKTDVDKLIDTVPKRRDWFLQSRPLFIVKLESILKNTKSKESKVLLKQVKSLDRDYLIHFESMRNLAVQIEAAFISMQDYMTRIVTFAKPLNSYVLNLKRTNNKIMSKKRI